MWCNFGHVTLQIWRDRTLRTPPCGPVNYRGANSQLSTSHLGSMRAGRLYLFSLQADCENSRRLAPLAWPLECNSNFEACMHDWRACQILHSAPTPNYQVLSHTPNPEPHAPHLTSLTTHGKPQPLDPQPYTWNRNLGSCMIGESFGQRPQPSASHLKHEPLIVWGRENLALLSGDLDHDKTVMANKTVQS